jgi:ribosomal protein S18 acetylase RimI-like enzyme
MNWELLAGLRIAPAAADERASAFGLLFRQLAEPYRQERIANSLRLVETGELPADGVLLARGPGGPLGALVCVPLPGAGGLVWPVQVVASRDREAVEDRLLEHGLAWLRRSGAKMAQALLTLPEQPLAAALERNGFDHVTALWYMRRGLDLPAGYLRAPERLTYRSYADGDTSLFHKTLLRTYEGTLDCPELNGVRTLDEILEGHRGQGQYNPSCWWLALEEDEPVGVLLLVEVEDWDAWDVAYVGVVPEKRGRGWGREIMRKALRSAHGLAQDWATGQVTLSVDARNRPAWGLYRSLGFEAFELREVYLLVWGSP